MIGILSVFFPFIASLFSGFLVFIRPNNNKNSFIVWLFNTLCMIFSLVFILLVANKVIIHDINLSVNLFSWFNYVGIDVNWSLTFDTLSIVMLLVVALISTMVHIYSYGYMGKETSFARYMFFISLFTFAMNILVTSNNLLQLFLGWEGVGVCSYLLIGYYNKDIGNNAAIKAFIVNRIGDLGFLLGIFLIFYSTKSIYFVDIFSNYKLLEDVVVSFLGIQLSYLDIACLLLLWGAMGKSAQFGLHTWLPDAMAGPTPASALIHAATMVTAGVFLIARTSPLFEVSVFAQNAVLLVGAITALFAGLVGMLQKDIKKIIAFSTCSQIGYMFMALGVGVYGGAIFHLATHAMFKALLFLCAGSVIHGLNGEQDIFKMGGIAKKMPVTFVLMLVGTLSITGFPLLSGYFSKDFIIEAVSVSNIAIGKFAFILAVIGAFLTAFYSWRLIFLVFFGTSRLDKYDYDHAHESPSSMTIPMIILGLFSVFLGGAVYSYFVGDNYIAFWKDSIDYNKSVIEAAHHVGLMVKLLPLISGMLGFLLAFKLYMFKTINNKDVSNSGFVYNLLYNQFYINELYNLIFVKGFYRLALLCKFFDVCIIDGILRKTNAIVEKSGDLHNSIENKINLGFVNGVVNIIEWCSGRLRTIQNGLVSVYSLMMAGGLVILLLIVAFVN